MDIKLTTYKDLLDHVVDYLGANPSAEAYRDARRAVQAGYRDFANRHRWTYYYTRGRLNTVAPYSDGTIAYSQATRTVTLTSTDGGAFPSWSAESDLTLTSSSGPFPGNVVYEVASNPSQTTLVLTQHSNPGQDIPAGATYSIYQDTYPLPVDCLALDRMILVNNAYSLWYDHPAAWLERQRIYHSPAIPRVYTIRGDPNHMGSLAVSFYPAPDNVYQFDFIYQRRPRPLLQDMVFAGTVSTGSMSATITGTGTKWTAQMVGSVLRIGWDGQNLPTGLAGAHAAQYERIITAVAGPTSLTVDALIDQTLGPLTYLISDPCDLEEGAMLTALQRSCEFQVSLSRSKKDRDVAMTLYKQALLEAMEQDSRNFAAETVGPGRMFPYRLAQMPKGPDVS